MKYSRVLSRISAWLLSWLWNVTVGFALGTFLFGTLVHMYAQTRMGALVALGVAWCTTWWIHLCVECVEAAIRNMKGAGATFLDLLGLRLVATSLVIASLVAGALAVGVLGLDDGVGRAGIKGRKPPSLVFARTAPDVGPLEEGHGTVEQDASCADAKWPAVASRPSHWRPQ
jgi:hypothetical protein